MAFNLVIDGALRTGGTSITADVAGAVAGTLVTAVEQNAGGIHRTVLTLAARSMAVTDALAYLGTKIYDFPEGRILFLGCTGSIQWAVTTARDTTINDSAALDWSLGSATASSITLTSTMVDLLPKVDIDLAAATTALNTASPGALAVAAQFDGTTTALDMFLNVGFPTNTDIDGDGTLTATGTITFAWIHMGDY